MVYCCITVHWYARYSTDEHFLFLLIFLKYQMFKWAEAQQLDSIT